MRKMLVALALVCVVSVPARAQFGRGFTDGSLLLAVPDVQKALSLTDDQKKKVTEATEAFTKAMTKARENFDLQSFGKVMEDYGKDLKAVADKLDEKQTARLLEIEVQQAIRTNNPRIFAKEGVQKGLDLSAKQKDLVKDTVAALDKSLKELQEEIAADFTKIATLRGKFQELPKEAYDKIVKELDEDQKKILTTKLGGEKLDIDMRSLFGGFGRGKDKKEDKKDN